MRRNFPTILWFVDRFCEVEKKCRKNLLVLHKTVQKSVLWLFTSHSKNTRKTPGVCWKVSSMFQEYAGESPAWSRSSQESFQNVPGVRGRVFRMFQECAEESLACSRSMGESPQHVPGVHGRVSSMFNEHEQSIKFWQLLRLTPEHFG